MLWRVQQQHMHMLVRLRLPELLLLSDEGVFELSQGQAKGVAHLHRVVYCTKQAAAQRRRQSWAAVSVSQPRCCRVVELLIWDTNLMIDQTS